MPRGDRTGPWGSGPMTGRAAGYCAGYPVPGFMNPAPRYGRGIGFRRGWGRGRGRGFGSLLEDRLDLSGRADIALDEAITRMRLDILEVLEVPRVGQRVEVDDIQVLALREDVVDEVRPDETRTACDQYVLHLWQDLVSIALREPVHLRGIG